MASGVSTSMVLTLLGFCVSVLFIVFVCSRLVCALVRRRRRRSRATPLPPGFPPLAANYFFAVQVDRLGGAQPAPAGLDSAAVAAFPTRAYSSSAAGASTPSSSASSDAAPQCVVCLAEYEDKDLLRTLPYCGHNFHVACIDVWLKQHTTCPVCRISLSDYPDSKHTLPPLPSAAMTPPYSPEASRSDPCHCLFVGTGHSARSSDVLRNEPDQANQTVPGPSLDGPNNLSLYEVTSPGENNNDTVK